MLGGLAGAGLTIGGFFGGPASAARKMVGGPGESFDGIEAPAQLPYAPRNIRRGLINYSALYGG